jgi:hypothetical protein
MTKKIKTSETTKPQRRNGAVILLGMFAATLLLMVALSALALKFLSPKPTVEPEVLQQAAASTLDVAVPIYVDETINAILPGIISGTLTAIAPTPTPIPPTPTPPVVPCDQAGFVSDGTVPDGTRLKSSAAFTKVWIVRNLGTCTWAEDYALVFFDGELMAGKSPITLGRELAPGDSMEISVNLVAPAAGGVYTSRWMLHNSSGDAFGLAPDDQPLSLHISVGSHESVALDLVDQVCFATWSSATGDLECPGDEDIVAGAVNPVDNTIGEAGVEFSVPALEVIPNEGPDGQIVGTYELLEVVEKDSFNAIIGCSDNQPDCDLVFELLIDTGNHQPISLGSWMEVTDGAHQKVSVDLSPYTGKTIRLILSVKSQNGMAYDNKGLWISPVVLRTNK